MRRQAKAQLFLFITLIVTSSSVCDRGRDGRYHFSYRSVQERPGGARAEMNSAQCQLAWGADPGGSATPDYRLIHCGWHSMSWGLCIVYVLERTHSVAPKP